MIYQTTILATFVSMALVIAVPKKYFLLPFVLVACFIPADQRALIFGLDFTPLRMLIVVGFLRTIILSERLTFKWNRFDRLVIAWAFCGAIIFVIQWANMRTLIYTCGMLFDIIGLYWLFRINITSWNDIKLTIKILAISSLAMAVLVGFEWVSGKNPFAIMGRVHTVTRQGRYRCQASFPHSIMLGLFWTTIFPLFIGLARTEQQKIYWAAAAASIFIVAATASSTPYLTMLVVIIILCGYKWRQYMRFAAWGLIASIIALHVIMKGPVWSLIANMTVVPGSTGYHRFILIDRAIHYFNEWAILGTRSTEHWGSGLLDITNQYITEGIRGGLITLILFLVMLYMALRLLLHLSIQYREYNQRFLVWCFFAVIVGHCIAFFGVSYFGQMRMWWSMSLAITSFFSQNKAIPPKIVTTPELADMQRLRYEYV